MPRWFSCSFPPWFSSRPPAAPVRHRNNRAKNAGITEARAREIAHDDARKVLPDLSGYKVQASLQDDGWHVDYELKETASQGGGPHYLIDSRDGKIIKKEYTQ